MSRRSREWPPGISILVRKDYAMKRRAFTLIELLVVISIIALLISILLPSLRQARLSAKALACGVSLKQTALAMQVYAEDYDGHIPSVYDGATGLLWQHKLEPYIQKERPYELLHCPLVDLEINGSSTIAFGLNTALIETNYLDSKDLTYLTQPSATIFVADTIARAGALQPFHAYPSSTAALLPRDGFAAFLNVAGEADYRHMEKTNVLYVDSHVENGEVPHNDGSSQNNQLPWKGES